MNSQNVTVIGDKITFLDGFALFVASLVLFKFVFAMIYYLKWNFRLSVRPYYRKSKNDVAEEFKRLRKDRNGMYSSDEDEDDLDFEPKLGKNESGVQMMIKGQGDGESMEFAKSNQEIDDSDNDDAEFESAHVEEQEDIVY